MVGVSYHQRLLFELLPFHAFKGARRDGKKEMQLENRAAMTLSSPNRWRSRTNQPLSLGHVFTHSPSVERPQRITRRTRVGWWMYSSNPTMISYQLGESLVQFLLRWFIFTWFFLARQEGNPPEGLDYFIYFLGASFRFIVAMDGGRDGWKGLSNTQVHSKALV